MSLLEIVTEAAEEVGYSVDTKVIGSTDITTKQLRRIADRLLAEMAEEFPWPALFKQGSFTLQSNEPLYALPGDFSSYHYDTFWNDSDGWRVLGPLSPQELAEIEGYGLTSSVYDNFQIRGIADKQLRIVPTPGSGSAGKIIIVEYLAARYARPQTWVMSLDIEVGDYVFYNGNYYIATSSGTTGSTPPTHLDPDTPTSDGGVEWDYYEGPYEKFLADTDEPLLSQRVLTQGVKEEFAALKGVTATAKFEIQKEIEFSKKVPGKTLYAGGVAGTILWAENGRVMFGGATR